jgi:enoyl-CoA hydratase/carnithine racemase
MNRPSRHNALNTGLTDALLQAMRDVQADAACHAIVLAGAGPSFCAGADTTEFKALSDNRDAAASDRAELTAALHGVFREIDKPIISAVHGNALGGGAGLALAADLVIAADDMRLGYPELKHGIVAAIVMTNLVRQIGPKAAFGLVATGRTLNGADAASLGLTFDVRPAAEVLGRAVEVATIMASWSPIAMMATKKLFNEVQDLPFAEGLAAGRRMNQAMRSFPRPEKAVSNG